MTRFAGPLHHLMHANPKFTYIDECSVMSRLKPTSLKVSAFLALVSVVLTSPAFANRVTVERDGREISITGDANANSIVISQVGNSRIIVRGAAGTLVNGSSRVTINNIDLLDLEVALFGGNDQVRLNNLSVAGDVSINLGSGNDRVLGGSLPCSIAVDLDIIGGPGRDVFSFRNWDIGGDLSILGNGGALFARLDAITVGADLDLVGNQFDDTIRLTNAIIGGELDIRTFRGDDRITVLDTMVESIDVATSSGDDDVVLRRILTSLDLDIETGDDDDLVVLDQVDVGTFLEVILEDGADNLVGRTVFAGLEIFFSGGPGEDSFRDLGVSSDGILEIVDFENFQ